MIKTKLEPSETVLTGEWIVEDKKVRRDAVCERIRWLVHDHLQFLGKADGGWSTLYKDPADGRFWEHTYPHSERHGGGPPELHVLSRKQAIEKYSLNVA